MKKAQVQFMEMIFVLLILIVIIFVGMFFYFYFSLGSIKEKGEEFQDIDATTLINSVIGMPEITCGTNCVDAVKMIKFDENFQSSNSNFYRQVFKNMNVTVKKIYPVPSISAKGVRCDDVKFQDANYPENCDYFVINTGKMEPGDAKEIIENPVSIYYPTTGENAFGVIRIEVFK